MPNNSIDEDKLKRDIALTLAVYITPPALVVTGLTYYSPALGGMVAVAMLFSCLMVMG